MEIGDLSEKESMEYLISKREINEEEAKKLYKLVGGRIVELKTVADDFLAKQSFEGMFGLTLKFNEFMQLTSNFISADIKKQLFMKVEDKFRTAKLLENYEHHEVGKRIIKALSDSDSKELSRIEYDKFFKEPEGANKVLESNVFAYHPEKNTVTFQSRSVECYVADIFLK